MDQKKQLPFPLVQGDPARLFPILADTSKEGRSLSILLACLQNVREFRRVMFGDLHVRVGSRSTFEAYTEVVLEKNSSGKSLRPDGFVRIGTPSSNWSSLVEAKVGSSILNSEQIESYMDVAKSNSVDSVITISNQFTSSPSIHPVAISSNAQRKANLYHWSWRYVQTQAQLLISKEEIKDADQHSILNELVRFLNHSSSGVKDFDSMPSSWREIVAAVQVGAEISANSHEVSEIIDAWYQEVRDLSLMFSRELGENVSVRLPRNHLADPTSRQKSDRVQLASEKCLKVTFNVPNAAAPIDFLANLQTRSVTISMRLKAPSDRKSTSARLNWLLRQIKNSNPKNIFVRLYWPGRAPMSQFALSVLQEDVGLASASRKDLAPISLEVAFVRDLAGRFGQTRNFITEIESMVPEFYIQIGQHLKSWQAPAPKLQEEIVVSPVELQDADVSAMEMHESSLDS